MTFPEQVEKRVDPLAMCLVFAAVGILVDHAVSLPCTIWNALLVFALLAFFGLSFVSRSEANVTRSRDKKRAKIWFFTDANPRSFLILMGVAFFFGSLHHDRWNRFEANDIGFFAKTEPQPVCLRGNVSRSAFLVPAPPPDPGQPIPVPPKVGFVLDVRSVRDGETWISVSGRCMVYVDNSETLPKYGDSLLIYGTLSAPSRAKNPGDYDAAFRLRARRILAVVRVQYENSCKIETPGAFSLFRLLETIRRDAQRNLRRFMGESASALAAAMLLGFREDVELATEQTLLETGTMHILAISGMHVGLISGFIYFVFQILRCSRRTTALGMILFVILYFCLTDQRAPALRATLLICIGSLAVLFHRKAFSPNTLCATALLILLGNPGELFHFGAQLSFLATSVFLWLPSSRSMLPRILPFLWNREDANIPTLSWFFREKMFELFYRIVDLFLVSLAITFVSLPLILEQIHLVTPVALLVNPTLWIPLTLALVSGFATMLLAWMCPPCADATAAVASRSFEILEGWISLFHKLPGGHFWSPGPPRWWLFGFYLALAGLTLFPVLRPKKRVIATVFLAWCLVGFAGSVFKRGEKYASNRLDIHILSVGHGTSTLFVTPEGKTLVYDAGCFSRAAIAGEALSRSLWRAGKTRIDTLVISHPDSDHFNAVPLLAERFAIGEVCFSPYMFDKQTNSVRHLRDVLHARRIPLRVVSSGEEITLGKNVRARILHPGAKHDPNTSDPDILPNSAGIVLWVEHCGKSVLFPGDLETKGKSIPVAFLDAPPLACEAIMIPHHGGSSDLTEPLVRWSRPNTLLVSGGRFTYHREFLDDFRRRGYDLYHTLEDGCTSIAVGKRGIRYRTFRTKRDTFKSVTKFHP